MPNYSVQLPNGRTIRVTDAPDETAARTRVSQFLEEEQRARPIDSFGESFMAGLRGTGGAAIGAGEAAAAATGIEGARRFVGGIREAVQGEDADAATRAPTLRDVLRRPTEAIPAYAGQAFGSLAGVGAGALAGAGVGAAVGGGAGAVPGAVAGGLYTARAAGIGELYQGLVQEGVDPQTAGLISIPVGIAIGRIETRYLDDFLRSQLQGRVPDSVISRVTARLVGGRAGGVRGSTAAGVVSEGGGEALRQATIAGVTGDLNLAERAERVAEEAFVGAFPGAAFGVANRFTGRAGETAAPPEQPPTAQQPAAPEPPPILPPEPAPLTTPEEAASFIAADPARRPRVPLEGEALVRHANLIQQRDWQDETAILRNNEVSNFLGLGRQDTTEVTDEQGRTRTVRDLRRSADVLLPRLYDADVAGDISLQDGFTVEDVTNLALREAGVVDLAPSELATVRKTLNDMSSQGILQRTTTRDASGRRQTSYTIAPRNLEPLRQMAAERRQQAAMPTRADRIPGEAEATEAALAFPNLVAMARQAPPSADQVAATQALQNLNQIANPNAAVAQQAQTQLSQLEQTLSERQRTQVDNYLGLTEEANQLTEQRRQLPLESGRPELLPLVQAIDARLNEIQGQRASILNELEGIAQGTFRATQLPDQPFVRGELREQAPAPATPTTQIGLTAPSATPTTPTEQDVAARSEAAAAEVRQAIDANMVRNLVAENPIATRTFLADLSSTLGPRANFGAQRIRSLAAMRGIPMSEAEARMFSDWAFADGFTNGLGNLTGRPQDQPRTPRLARPGRVGRSGAEPLGRPEAEETPVGETAFEEPAPTDRPVAFAAAPTGRTPTRTEAEQQEARALFERTVGSAGKLTFEQQLLLQDLGAEVQAAAEAAGIDTPIAGYSYGDMAVLSLADSSMPLNQVAIHEGWHVAENVGIIKANDIAILDASRNTILNRIRNDLDFVADPDTLPNNEIRAYGLNARATRGTDFGPAVNSIFDRFVNLLGRVSNFLSGRGFRTWRDVYDDFLAGRFATKEFPGESTSVYNTDSNRINFAAPRPLSNAQQAGPAIQQAVDNQIGFFRNWFGSLNLTISKDRPALRPASDNMQTGRHSRNEATAELENFIEPIARLKTPESRRKVMRVWQTASMTGRAPVTNTLSAEEQAALQAAIAGVQRAFDWLIEAHVINNFMPTSNKTQAEQTRLNNFWARHADKHLWEIPQNELRAASPQGFAEYQRLNKMRNPYKLPAIADGSHFVAVYKRNARGDKEGRPIAMISYNPLSLPQRIRRFEDPETIARAELQSLYPDSKRYYIMPSGQEFTLNDDARQVRDQGDAVSKFLSDLSQIPVIRNSSQARARLATLIDQMNKQQIERMFQKSNNILLAVNNLNDSSYATDVLPRYMMGVANVQARRRTQEGWAEATKGLSASDQKWLNDHRDYSYTPSESFGAMRSFTFFYLLGFAPDTALINFLQVFQVSMPMMIRDGGLSSLGTFRKAYSQIIDASQKALQEALKKGPAQARNTVDVIRTQLKDPQEVADYERALKVGTLLPIFLNESRGQITVAGLKKAGIKNAEAWAKRFNTTLKWAGGLQQYVEQTNRAATFLAAYRAAKANPQMIANKNRADNQNLQTPYDYATAIVDDTHHITDKADRARFQRFTPLAEPATQFMSFVAKSIELYVRHAAMALKGVAKGDPFMAKAGAVGLITMVAPLVALGGIWALPGFEFLKELMESMVKEFWKTPANWDADLRRALGGGQIAEAFSKGIPAAFGYAVLSKRLALDPIPFADFTGAQTLSLVAGPSAAFPEALARAYQYFQQGDLMNAAAAFLPRALGNVVKGADLGFVNQTVRSQRGNVLISPEQVAEVDSTHFVPSWVRQTVGLPAPELVSLREVVARREELARQNTDATQRINNRLASDLTDMMRAYQRGKTDEAERARTRYLERVQKQMEANLANIERGRIDLVININNDAIQRRAYEDLVGRSSPQVGMRGIPQNIRPRVQEELDIYDWRRAARQQAQ